jgi:hypothetical protein
VRRKFLWVTHPRQRNPKFRMLAVQYCSLLCRRARIFAVALVRVKWSPLQCLLPSPIRGRREGPGRVEKDLVESTRFTTRSPPTSIISRSKIRQPHRNAIRSFHALKTYHRAVPQRTVFGTTVIRKGGRSCRVQVQHCNSFLSSSARFWDKNEHSMHSDFGSFNPQHPLCTLDVSAKDLVVPVHCPPRDPRGIAIADHPSRTSSATAITDCSWRGLNKTCVDGCAP